MGTLSGCTASALDSIGDSGCLTTPILNMIQAIIPEADSHSYASLTTFKDEDVNKASIASRGILPLKIFDEVEAANVEEITSNTSTGVKLFHADGKYGLIGFMRMSPDQNRILQSYNNKVNKVYLMDGKGNRLGTEASDGSSIVGLSVEYFRVMPMDLPVAADGTAWSKVEVQLKYVSEINKTPRYSIAEELDPYWDPLKEIKPMTKLTITTGTVAANTFTAAIAYVDPTTGKSEIYRGALPVDFLVYDESGDLVTVTVTETATLGTYDVAGTMVSGTIQMVASATSLFYSDVTTASA